MLLISGTLTPIILALETSGISREVKSPYSSSRTSSIRPFKISSNLFIL